MECKGRRALGTELISGKPEKVSIEKILPKVDGSDMRCK